MNRVVVRVAFIAFGSADKMKAFFLSVDQGILFSGD
jgi:hypothetical protein